MPRLLLSCAVAGALLFAPAAWARDPSPEERADLEAALEVFYTALAEADAATVVGVIPPRLLQRLADLYETPLPEVLSAMTEQTRHALQTVELSSFESDLDTLDLAEDSLEDGTEVLWGFVPYVATGTLDGVEQDFEQPMLVLREDGTWYFVRVESPAALSFIAAGYPFLEGADVPYPDAVQQ
ncbi:hypothetical protein HKCCE2091_01655 [Rhodobacterales bacterium HKCCE2091]|nr:hypothetical protein [Rhodobacterales bacterium HKCCE2091]